MSDPTPPTAVPASPSASSVDTRPYSPGLQGVIGAESNIGMVDGDNGRLTYYGYRIGDLVRHGGYAQVANLLWTGEWDSKATLPPAPVPKEVMIALRAIPTDTHPMDALRTAVSVWGAANHIAWPPNPEQARALTAFSPSAMAAFDRIRRGLEPIQPDPGMDLATGFLYQLTGQVPHPGTARALDAYFVTGAEHGLNASTFAARVIVGTRSDLASAVCGAIGAMKGPLHGGAPAEVVNQLLEIGSIDRAEAWVRKTITEGDLIMGFGHRVYRAYDPRATALREVAESMENRPEWLGLAIQVEDVVLRLLKELKTGRPLYTNVEYYAAAVLQGIGLTPDLFPATFALSRHAGWTAHSIEQVVANKLIRPDMRYTGPAERDLPA
jgi:citrate synthase